MTQNMHQRPPPQKKRHSFINSSIHITVRKVWRRIGKPKIGEGINERRSKPPHPPNQEY